jgi:hypothetical protein
LPSSHSSSPTRIESPHDEEQYDLLHVDDEHAHPASTLHAIEQPSPFCEFPSSHSSSPANNPSPHWVLHVSSFEASPPEQVQAHSTAHVESQPSPSFKLPSSHRPAFEPSSPTETPSPHTCRESVSFFGTRVSNLYTAVDTPAKAA